MRSKLLICLSVLVALLGAAQASKHMKIHPWKLGHKQELLQTKSTAETVATAETTTESEAECDPECVYKFPYLDSKCSIPTPITKPGEIFVTDFEDCFTFDVVVPLPPKEEHGETFVVDFEACYDYRRTPLPEGPPKPPLDNTPEPEPEPEPEPTKTPVHTPEPEKNETCETKVTVYRYPFIDPDANCTVDEKPKKTIEVTNPNKTIAPEIIIITDEGGNEYEAKIDEYGEYHAVPPEVHPKPIVTYDEEAEIVLDEEDREGGGGTKEEFVLLFDVCYTYSQDEATEETIYESHEDVTTGDYEKDIEWQTNEENVVIDEQKEVILIPPETPPPEYNPPPTNTTTPNPPTPPPEEPPKNDTTPPKNETTPPKNETTPPKNETTPPKNETTPPPPTPPDTEGECIIYDNYTTGTTIVYGQPVTYITKNTYDIHQHHGVSYTYVLTNIYSGIFKTEEYNYVIYGAGAVNFYNNYYNIDARVHDSPSCSCTCGYQTYTFTYSFGF